MKSQRRALLGLFLVLIGSVLLLDNLNIIPEIPDYIFNWINIFLLIALVNLLSGNARGTAIFLILWVFFTVNQYFDINMRDFWPLILVIIGISLIMRKSFGGTNLVDDDYFDEVNIFGGSSKKFTSQQLKGGKSTNIFGGSDIDLRGAIPESGAVIEIFTLFGGCDIIVPDDWNVNVKTTSIFGGFEDKRITPPNHNGPLVYIKGTTIFGGGDLKSMK